MITLNMKSSQYFKKLGFATVIAAFVFFVIGIFIGEFTDLVLVSIGVMIGSGGASVINANAMDERYATYFENGSVKTISELATELGLKEKVVIKNLTIYAKRPDRKNLKRCENVKFEV